MTRILSYLLAAVAVCAISFGNAEAATRKHHNTGRFASVAAKLKTVGNRQLCQRVRAGEHPLDRRRRWLEIFERNLG